METYPLLNVATLIKTLPKLFGFSRFFVPNEQVIHVLHMVVFAECCHIGKVFWTG